MSDIVERVELFGMPCVVVDAVPSDVVIIVPPLARRPGESDKALDLRRVNGSVKLINVGGMNSPFVAPR